MGYFAVIAAAIATFAVGAGYYMALAKPWMEASGIEADVDGRPTGDASPLPYIVSFVMIILVLAWVRSL